MVPYIALLILLIVAILFTVYKGADGFFVSEVNWTKNSTVKDMLTFYKESLDELTKLKDKIASASPFDDGVTEKLLEELGIPFAWTEAKGLEYEKPLSSVLAKTIAEDEKAAAGMLEMLQKDIQSGKIKENMTLEQAMKALGAGDADNTGAMNQFTNMMVKLRNKRKAYIEEKLGVSTSDVSAKGYPELTCPGGKPPVSKNKQLFCRDLVGKLSETPLLCPLGTTPFFVFEPTAKVICVPPTLPYDINPASKTSGGTIQPCKDNDMVGLNAKDNTSQKCIPLIQKVSITESVVESSIDSSGNVAGVSAEDLFKAVGGVQQALKASKPAEIEKIQAAAPKLTVASTKEMEDRIAKSVATQLKDSLLVERATKNVAAEMDCPYAPYRSDSAAQGTEYTQARPNPGPDMSEFIRKDSIPCWNCSLP
jgi:hypothetical protein